MKKYFIWGLFAFFLITNSALGVKIEIKDHHYNEKNSYMYKATHNIYFSEEKDRVEINDWVFENWKYKSNKLEIDTPFCKNYQGEKVPKFFYIKNLDNYVFDDVEKCSVKHKHHISSEEENCVNKLIVQDQIEDFCRNYDKFQKEKNKEDNPKIENKCNLTKWELKVAYASYIEGMKMNYSYWDKKQFWIFIWNKKVDNEDLMQKLAWEKYSIESALEIYWKYQRALIAEKELQNIDNECKKTEEIKKEEPKQDVKKEETKKDEPKEEPKKVVKKEVKKDLIDKLLSKYSKQTLQKLILPLETLRNDPKYEDRTDIIDYLLLKIKSL